MVALGDVPEQQLGRRLGGHAHGVDGHLPRVELADAEQHLVVVPPVDLRGGDDVDLVASLVRHRVVDGAQQLAAAGHGRQPLDPILRRLEGGLRGRRHLLGPEPRLAGALGEADQLEGRLRRHLRVEHALQGRLQVGDVAAGHAGRVHDEHRVGASGVQRDHGLLHLHHDALHLVEGLVRVRQHEVDMLILGMAPGDQGLEAPQGRTEEVHVFLPGLDVGLAHAVEALDVGPGYVVMDRHRGAGVGAQRRLRSHEDGDEGAGVLQEARAHELPERGHELGLRDEVALHVLQHEFAQPRRQALDQPVSVVGLQRHGVARVVHAHGVVRHLLRNELLARPRQHLPAMLHGQRGVVLLRRAGRQLRRRRRRRQGLWRGRHRLRVRLLLRLLRLAQNLRRQRDHGLDGHAAMLVDRWRRDGRIRLPELHHGSRRLFDCAVRVGAAGRRVDDEQSGVAGAALRQRRRGQHPV
mmetsp:Transcript_30409/g.77381  ORF Transcript_30409/g.77381 Transcript_30409/m.77381 type:complete len:467 (-) Transcript_30409:333-1733(-)